MSLNGKALFSLFIAVLMLIMVISSFNYPFNARIFPFTLGFVVFVMALIQFLGEVFPQIRRVFTFLNQEGVQLTGGNRNIGQIEAEEENYKKEVSWLKIYYIFIWLIFFVLMLYFTHFLIAVGIFLFLFVWFVAKERILVSLLLSIGTTAAMFILFKLILDVRF